MSAQRACGLADVPVGSALRVELVGAKGLVEVAVVRDDGGELHAISDICSHGQVSLSDGEVEGSTIECWLHGSRFDLRTGEPLSPPAVRPVPVYPLTVDGESVFVDIDANGSPEES
ncbi:MAG: non-heme iron oxygenase ferredoxin subunit [Cellulomonas sp.]